MKFSLSGPGNFHVFMPERRSAPDAGDALRRASRGPGNGHFPMGRRANAADPAGLRRRAASVAGLLRTVLPGAMRGNDVGTGA